MDAIWDVLSGVLNPDWLTRAQIAKTNQAVIFVANNQSVLSCLIM